MPMTPGENESQSEFMARCVPEMMGSDGDERPQEQAVAACMSMWRDAQDDDEKDDEPEPEKAAGIRRIIARWKERFRDAPSLDAIVALASRQAPEPDDEESYSEFMERCVDELGEDIDDDGAENVCQTQWESRGARSARARRRHVRELADECPEPGENESRDEFMERCIVSLAGDDGLGESSVDSDDARSACETAWGNASGRSARRLRHKTHAEPVHGMEFILSDETVDRMGDIIKASGWDFANFQKNPIALFNHDSDFPIGKWSNIRIERTTLRGSLELAPEGTSDRIDEIRRLINAGILKAVSVGFRALDSEPRVDADDRYLGYTFTRQELVETSLVSVPANPNALAVAKSLRISPATLSLVFAEPGARMRAKGRGPIGRHAETRSQNGKGATMSLSQRITDQRNRLNADRDQLQAHLSRVDDSNVSDADLTVTNELNARIAQGERSLASLLESEARLATNGAPPRNDDGSLLELRMPTHRVNPPSARPFTVPARKVEPIDYVWRSLTCLVKHYRGHGARSMDTILKETYGEDEGTRTIMNVITRAASTEATMTGTGWAAELVAVVMGEFYKALIPMAVFPKLAAKGSSFTFGRFGIINLPMRSTTPTVAGSFVGEGAPIPVRQGQFVTQQMTPKKMAVITTFTREIAEHSTPAIEGILRDAVLEDTSVAIDTVLLDANPKDAIRPAGILNGITGLTPTAGGGFTALLGDIKQLTNALIVATRGNFRQPAWIMSPALSIAIALTPTTGAQALPFREEVSRGFLIGIPIIESTTVTAGTLILIDGADFSSVTGDDPRFEVSDQAVLHMEDTTPLAIGTPGTPPTVAAPARSLWQTDTIGLRMILPMNWTMRRPLSVAFVSGVTWQ